MHKIKKGIKKKIKGKKGKGDDEIFTPEELEEYKRRQEEAKKPDEVPETDHAVEEAKSEVKTSEVQEQAAAVHLESGGETPSDSTEVEPNKTDWKNFLSTTDTVLKQTTEHLEQIKETSYYQKKPVHEEVPVVALTNTATHLPSASPAPPTNWVNLEKGGFDDNPEDNEAEGEEVAAEQVRGPTPEPVELKPIDDFPDVDVEDYLDAFDTTFVDNVESGDVKLHYIPDSPTFDDPNEPDPFDTSGVDKVLEGEKVKKEKKTNKQTRQEGPPKKKKQLVSLGCAVEVLTGKLADKPNVTATKDKRRVVENEINLFGDELVDITNEDITDDVKEEVETKEQIQNALEDILFGDDIEAEVIETSIPITLTPLPNTESSEHENVCNKTNEVDLSEFLDISSEKEDNKTVNKKTNDDNDLRDLVAEFDVIDTTEILDEKLIPDENNDFDEFAELAAESVYKAKEAEFDPFDTTVAAGVLGPEAATPEDKDPFDIEFANEVLKDTDKEVPTRPPPPTAKPTEPKSEFELLEEELLNDPFDTSAVNKVVPLGLIDDADGAEPLAESLQPLTADTFPKSESFDPFDTSAAAAFGKTELKCLENELLNDNVNSSSIPKSDSDFDFDPRADEQIKGKPLRPPSPACLLSNQGEESSDPVLTPQALAEDIEFDPFDTSIADKVQIQSLEEILLEDKSTGKVVENNTLTVKQLPPRRPPSPNSLLTDAITDENPALQPVTTEGATTTFNEVDPFDTSIADQFGKTELKVLATELLESQTTPNQSSFPENNLKLNLKPPRPASPQCLLTATPVDENPTLQPILKESSKAVVEKEELDPFDTSIADQFGKTELKALESELLVAAKLQEDNEFDPRAVTPTPQRPSRPPSPAVTRCLLTSESPQDFTATDTLLPTAPKSCSTTEELDPFDTSIAESYGKQELKHLESELLSDISTHKTNLTNTNLPPGPPKPSSPAIEDNFNSKNLHIDLKTEKETSSNLQPLTADHLFDSSPSAEHIPTLQPVLHIKSQEPQEIDPFDTSIAAQFGKTELKVLESELITDSVRDLSDDEFDPRIDESNTRKVVTSKPIEKPKPIDLFDSIDHENIPDIPIIAAQASNSNEIYKLNTDHDPFDTFIAANVVPGKTELKLLESELLSETEKDPFDTSNI